MRRRGIIAVDNPLNGYVEGHCDSEDLGIFVLSPRSMEIRNCPPEQDHVWLWSEIGNSFDEDFNGFETDTI